MLYFYFSLHSCSNILTDLPKNEKENVLLQIERISENIEKYKSIISNALSVLNLQAIHVKEMLKTYNSNKSGFSEIIFTTIYNWIFLNSRTSLHFLIKIEKYLSENMNDLYRTIDLIDDSNDKIFLKEKAANVLLFEENIFYDMIAQIDLNLENLQSCLNQSRYSIRFRDPLMQHFLNMYLEKHRDIIMIIELCKIQFLNVICSSKNFSIMFKND